ncbi:Protein translocase subunit SA2 [Ranunculus cassubicifolius]
MLLGISTGFLLVCIRLNNYVCNRFWDRFNDLLHENPAHSFNSSQLIDQIDSLFVVEGVVKYKDPGKPTVLINIGNEDIRAFLGHAGFYRRFIKDFSQTARPLTALLKNDIEFLFDDACLKAFNTLKSALLTGRVEEKRRWSDGIHQAVEAKEGLKIQTARGKWENAREEIVYMFRQGRPVLVGTTSVESSEYLSDLLKERNIPHNVLNARPKYAAKEAEIVAQAGRKFAITISTNMAGRGTDIILGGNPKMLAKEVMEDSIISFLTKDSPNVEIDGEPISQKGLTKIKIGPESLALLSKTALMAKYVSKSEGKRWGYQEARSMISESIQMSQSSSMEELEKLMGEETEVYPLAHCSYEGTEVKRLGGLHVIGTSLYESRRIDNQRGRAGRQGDPGSTRFLVSLQDEMFQKFEFDTEWAIKLISKITNDENLPIEGSYMLKQLLALQITVEKYFFGIRNNLVEFDEVLEVQRKHIYQLQQSILTGDSESCSQHIFQYMQAVVDETVFGNVNPVTHPRNWNLGKLLHEFVSITENILAGSFSEITEESLLKSFETPCELHDSIQIDSLSLPNLPPPPNAFRGIHRKKSSLKRWLDICSNESTQKGKYQGRSILLRKYLGDILIASYVQAIQQSGFDDAYIKEIERAVLVKTLDCFWRDHLVNMNTLNSAVNVRSFGYRNPLEEYKIDGCRYFISMLSATRRTTIEGEYRG